MNIQFAKHLDEFDYLRGIGIFFVVWGHMTLLLGEHDFLQTNSAGFSKMITFTVQGATAVFVFISGFMFYWVYYKRGFDYKTFLKSKFQHIFRPYFCIATIFTLLRVIYGVYISRFDQWYLWADNGFERILLSTYMYWAFWYVPFIAVVFVFSPVYIKFLETRRVWQFVIMLCAFSLSCLIGRENVNPLHSCAYFSIYYLFGICCAQNYDFIQSRSIKFWIRLLWVYLMTLLFFTLAGDFVYGAVRVDIFKDIADFVPLFKVPECLLLLWLAYKLAKLSEALKKIFFYLG